MRLCCNILGFTRRCRTVDDGSYAKSVLLIGRYQVGCHRRSSNRSAGQRIVGKIVDSSSVVFPLKQIGVLNVDLFPVDVQSAHCDNTKCRCHNPDVDLNEVVLIHIVQK